MEQFFTAKPTHTLTTFSHTGETIVSDKEKKAKDELNEAEDRVALAHHKEVGGYRGRMY